MLRAASGKRRRSAKAGWSGRRSPGPVLFAVQLVSGPKSEDLSRVSHGSTRVASRPVRRHGATVLEVPSAFAITAMRLRRRPDLDRARGSAAGGVQLWTRRIAVGLGGDLRQDLASRGQRDGAESGALVRQMIPGRSSVSRRCRKSYRIAGFCPRSHSSAVPRMEDDQHAHPRGKGSFRKWSLKRNPSRSRAGHRHRHVGSLMVLPRLPRRFVPCSAYVKGDIAGWRALRDERALAQRVRRLHEAPSRGQPGRLWDLFRQAGPPVRPPSRILAHPAHRIRELN